MNQTPNQNENGKNERKPPPLFKLIAAVLPVVVAWWIWKPLGAYCAILTVGFCGARFIWTLSLFLNAGKCSVVGFLWGLIMAGVVFVLASATVNSWWAKAFLGIWGWLALYYVACPTRTWTAKMMAGDIKLQFVAGLGMWSYILGLGIIWLVVWLHH